MSESDCQIVRICMNLNGSKIRTTQTRLSKLEPDLNLNWDMTDCPSFKLGQKFCDGTSFFLGWINSGNWILQIFASPNYNDIINGR